MAYRKTVLGEMVSEEPRAAAKLILRAYRRSRGNACEAARSLGVHHTTLLRWVARLELADRIVSVRSMHGAA